MKSVQIRSFFWSIFFCIQSEYRKIRTRKNFVFGHFSRSVTIYMFNESELTESLVGKSSIRSSNFKINKPSSEILNFVSRIIIIISFFKVDFHITSYNYKKPINVNLLRKLEKNSDTKRFTNSLI